MVMNTARYRWNLRWILTRQRPVTSLLFAVQKEWPNTMRGLHVGNVAIHGATAFLVERLAITLDFDEGLAFFAGLTYVVLPFAVNSVAYVTGRASLVSGFFGLAAAWAVAAGQAWVAFPLLALAVLAKEDGCGYVLQSAALMAWTEQFLALAWLGLGAAVAVFYSRKYLRRMVLNTGDASMRTINLPVSHPQPLHGFTVFVQTLWRIPFWTLGLCQSTWHGSGIKNTRFHLLGASAVLAGGVWIYRSF